MASKCKTLFTSLAIVISLAFFKIAANECRFDKILQIEKTAVTVIQIPQTYKQALMAY